MASRDGGEYRPLPVSLWSDPRFEALSAHESFVLLALWGNLTTAGIQNWPGVEVALHAYTKLSVADVEQALVGLQHHGWVERDRHVIWVVQAFAFDVSLSATNPKHRTFITRLIASLPALPIVDRFRARYAEWFTTRASKSAPEIPSPESADTHPDTLSPTVCDTHADSLSNRVSDTLCQSQYLTELDLTVPNQTKNDSDVDVILHSPGAGAREREISSSPPPSQKAPWWTRFAEITLRQRESIGTFLENDPPRTSIWASRIAGWLEGQGTPECKAMSLDDVAVGLEEYRLRANPNSANYRTPSHVVGFVAKARKRRIAIAPDAQNDPALFERARHLRGLVMQHGLAHVPGRQLQSRLLELGLEADAPDIVAIAPLRDYANDRTSDESVRKIAARLQARAASKPELQLLAGGAS